MKKLSKTILTGMVLASFLMLVATPVLAATVNEPIEPIQPTRAAVDCTKGTTDNPSNTPATLATLCSVLKIINVLIFIFQLLAILYFIMTVVKYITAGGDAGASKEAGQSILKAIVALGALFGAQLIINAIGKLAGIEAGTGVIEIPFFLG